MTRDKDGQVHLLLNRCPHRGNQVCLEDRGNTTSFVCSYHGWNFRNNGDLRGTPFPAGYQGVDKSEPRPRQGGARVQSYKRLRLRLVRGAR